MEHVDVLIVGAGLSGVGAACHLLRERPGTTFAVLEGREAIGGTWDLFRYPGVRSDSDMFTLSYSFRPWTGERAMADGDSIREYVRDTADAYGVTERIRFRHRVTRAAWSSADARWTVTVHRPDLDEEVTLTCGFLWSCCGYYRYDEGYTPEFEGLEHFVGTVVHPQRWPAELDYAGRRVVVIGSGATAMTLVPAMAETAEHVTMLQRSPTYVLSLPGRDGLADRLRRRLPAGAAHRMIRAKNVLAMTASYQLSRRRPETMKRLLRKSVAASLPPGFEVGGSFAPSYQPWDQRMCFVPDGDLFRALGRGTASIVTDRIERFVPSGIRLASGEVLEADIVVTATGLNLLAIGGIALEVDGEPVDVGRTVAYKSMMLAGVPNFAFVIGYTNASWTLKADLVSRFVCRLLKRMAARGETVCTPRLPEGPLELTPVLNLDAGYVRRGAGQTPQQASSNPWRVRHNYLLDLPHFRFGRIDDGALRFTRAAPR
jgi:cation diffusion facilitator CzcD-associated flavoprotein CzcO